MISLDDLVLRQDLDPRLGDRDDELVEQYAEIFDVLPPIEINQDKEIIDGWHRYLAARRAGVAEITYVVVETRDDDDLADRMWEANRKHGVQYTRGQRKAYGVKLHGRGLSAKGIAERVGVGVSSVYGWTKELREKVKQERDSEIRRLRDEGKTQQKIADALGVDRSTVARNVQDSKTGILHDEAETLEIIDVEPRVPSEDKESDILDSGSEEVPEATPEEPSGEPRPEPETGEVAADELSERELEPQSEAPPSEVEEVTEEPVDEPDPEPSPPEPIPADILKTARAVIGAFSEARPDGYVARLEASEAEWMTITDDSLSGEFERGLLTSAAAMCLWQEQMIWYQGENASSFTDAFGKIGPVFVRGRAGQWSIVSKLRSIFRRLRTYPQL